MGWGGAEGGGILISEEILYSISLIFENGSAPDGLVAFIESPCFLLD